MKIWNITSNWKEHNWNLESPMSKIWEIKKILGHTEWDSFWINVIKSNLLQLLKNWEYITFQKKIGMPEKLCDGLLWTTSLNYLIKYIVWIEDKWGNIVGETMKYIWNILKYGKTVKDNDIESWNEQSDVYIANLQDKESKKKDSNSIHMFWDTPIWEIFSHPILKDDETESFCCSKTARLNGLHFWISLPRWNAYTAWILPTSWIIETIPKEKSWEKPNINWWTITEWEFDLVDYSANFADVYAESSNFYWHRAIAIRDSQWKRYVLDPYIRINWKKTLKPIKLNDYITKWRRIIKAHFYHSSWYIN